VKVVFFINKIDIPKIQSLFFLKLTSIKKSSDTFHTKTNIIGGEQGDSLRNRCELKKKSAIFGTRNKLGFKNKLMNLKDLIFRGQGINLKTKLT